MNEWIGSIDLEKLKVMAPALYVFDGDPEDAAIFMYKEGLHEPMASAKKDEEVFYQSSKRLETRPPKKYWEQVKKEIFVLICTDDKKYDELRKKLNEAKEKGTNTIVALIAATIGGLLGIEAGIISGFCAILLHSIAKIGTEAYCAIKNT